MSQIERPDGRAQNEMRSLKVEVGLLHRADGSSRVDLGENIAFASVFGPRELHPKHSSSPEKAIVRVNYRMATFSVTDYKRSFPSRREKEISKVLSDAFQSVVLTKQFPRSAIDVHVQIFQSDGGTRTAAAIAISAALADAGIPMRDLTGGIASGIYGDKVVLDLSGHEDMKGTGDMPILYSPNIDEVSLFQLDGLFTFEQFKEAFYFSKDAITKVVETIQSALVKKYVKTREEIITDEIDEDIPVQDHDDTLTEDEVETVTLNNEDEDESVNVQEDFVVPSTTELEPNQESLEPEVKETSPPVVEKTDASITEISEDKSKSEDESDFDPRKIGNFDRSSLKPMGRSSEPDDTAEEKKKERSTSDILRDLEYSDVEDN